MVLQLKQFGKFQNHTDDDDVDDDHDHDDDDDELFPWYG